eukprot:3295325-Pleurochrysis_carterae.AAC.9
MRTPAQRQHPFRTTCPAVYPRKPSPFTALSVNKLCSYAASSSLFLYWRQILFVSFNESGWSLPPNLVHSGLLHCPLQAG